MMTRFRCRLTALSLAGLLLVPCAALATETAAPTEAAETTPQFSSWLAVGYRSFSLQGDARQALKYSYLRSHPSLTGSIHGDPGKSHLNLDLGYFNQHDYQLEGDWDYAGLVRAKVRLDGLFHNLDHLTADRPAASIPGFADVVTFKDWAPGAQYGIGVDRSEVGLRVKTGNFPAHVNLNYWRYEKSGHRQLRFVDENCTSCHLQSRSLGVNQVTEEITLGADAHLGPVDLGVEQLVREFRNRKAAPVDFFDNAGNRFAGDYQHDAIPDARLVQTTVKLHTSLAGGVVGGASASLGQRENQGDLSDVQGVKAETDFRKLAGDLSVSTSPRWSANFRYRMLDLDSSNSSFLTSAGAAVSNNILPQATRSPDPVREAIDFSRSTYSAGVSLRPLPLLIFKGDYQLEEVRRDQVGEAQPEVLVGVPVQVLNPFWQLPADEKIQTFRLSLLGRSRDRSKLRVNSWYQWRTSDDPGYAAAAEQSQEGFLGMTCTVTPKAGGSANLRLIRKENNQHEVVQVSANSRRSFNLDRRQDQENLSLGVYWAPVEGVIFTANYGLLQDHTEQDLLFGKEQLALVSRAADYEQRVQNLSLGGNWQLSKALSLSGEVHQTRSEAEFSPEFFASGLVFSGVPLGIAVDSSGLKQLSKVSLRQFGWNLGADWRYARAWSLGLRYGYDKFDDRTGRSFDGTVQTTLVSVARSW
jgi:hypothetical protein